MIHYPIQLNNLSLLLSHKICFENFTAQIHAQDRIAILGRNGNGKTTLLKILQGLIEPSAGNIQISSDVRIAYVPQVIEEGLTLSGAQRLQAALTRALAQNPNVLMLDEPTNHLDVKNHQSLLRMLHNFSGTLIIVSHHIQVLRHTVNRLWHIENGRISDFQGDYDDYLREVTIQRSSLEQELLCLKRQKKQAHQSLMKEQIRAKASRAQGEKNIHQRKWPTIVSDAKARRGEETSGRKKSGIKHKKQKLLDKLSDLRVPEVIIPKFSLKAADMSDKILVTL